MILDNTAIFSDGQAVTATAASTNIIDLQKAGTPMGAPAALVADVGKNTDIELDVRVVQDFATLTSLTVSVETAADGDAAFASPTTVAQSGAIPVASLVAGYQFPFPATIMEGVNGRYVRLKYTVTGSAATAGKITAAVVASRQTR